MRPASVSAIVTTYNRPDALREVLHGLVRQTRLPNQVLIADDGSGPETRLLVENFAQQAPFSIQHVWQADEGFRAAAIRNRAIEQASGEYLVFLDGDCIPSLQFIADHLKVARPGCWVQGKRVLVSESATAQGFSATHVQSLQILLRCWFRREINHPHRLLHWPGWQPRGSQKMRGIRSCNMGAWSRDVLRVGGFDERFTGWGLEDSEFAIRLYKLGLKRLDPQFAAICFHLWHPERPRDRYQENNVILQASQANITYETQHGIQREK